MNRVILPLFLVSTIAFDAHALHCKKGKPDWVIAGACEQGHVRAAFHLGIDARIDGDFLGALQIGRDLNIQGTSTTLLQASWISHNEHFRGLLQLGGINSSSRMQTGIQIGGAISSGDFDGVVQLGGTSDLSGDFSGLAQVSLGQRVLGDFNGILQGGGFSYARNFLGIGQLGVSNRTGAVRPELMTPFSDREAPPLIWSMLGDGYAAVGRFRGLFQAGLHNLAGDFVGGFQAGIVNRARYMRGIGQVGYFNHVHHLHGLTQLGILYNRVETGGGLQAGAFNSAGSFEGLQIGLINHADSLKGIQVGLLNFIYSSAVPMLPILNAAF